ncbi:MAG: PulJ/GspJ family protein [Phycisphaerae bacterium]
MTHVKPTAPRGFTLIEAMILLVVVSIVAVGAAVGLQSTVKVPDQTERFLVISSELTSEMETWRSVAFGDPPWPSSLPYSASDTVTLSVGGGSITCNRTVNIRKWDPDHLSTNTTPQDDFVRVQISIDGQSLDCYFSKPL